MSLRTVRSVAVPKDEPLANVVQSIAAAIESEAEDLAKAGYAVDPRTIRIDGESLARTVFLNIEMEATR